VNVSQGRRLSAKSAAIVDDFELDLSAYEVNEGHRFKIINILTLPSNVFL